MADPRFIVRDPSEQTVAGDDTFDDQLKFVAASVDGKVIDTASGEVVYDGGPGSGIDPDIN